MKRVLCIVADGVEETELVAPVDILRRAGIEVTLASAGGASTVTGKNGIVIGADRTLDDVAGGNYDALFLPGGPAVMDLRTDGRAAEIARSMAAEGKTVAAICAAPLLLEDAGLLAGKRHTAHFSTYDELTRAEADQRVVIDGEIITARGAGTAVEFGLALVAHLAGQEAADKVARAIMA